MKVLYTLIVILFWLTLSMCGTSNAFLTLVSMFVGCAVLYTLADRSVKIKIYVTLYSIGWVYLLACYMYMTSNNFEWLLAFDSGNYFFPRTQQYLYAGGYDIFRCIDVIFSEYSLFDRNQYFYWVYNCLWGIIGDKLGIDLYYTLQVSVLFLYAFSGVLIYGIFSHIDIEESYKKNCSLYICVFSILFFYSSQLLRDTHILICYLSAILLSLRNDFSVRNIISLLFIVFITSLIRVESGMFLLLTIPIYIYSQVKNNDNFFIVMISAFVVLFVFAFVFFNIATINNVIEENQDNFFSADLGNGIIGTLQKVPIVGDAISIFYNAVQPIPFWSRISPDGGKYGREAYNYLNLVRGVNSAFHIFCIVILLKVFSKKSTRLELMHKLPPAFKYQLIAGLLYLFLQSSIVSQRRLMGYYCVFFILAMTYYSQCSQIDRKSVNNATIVLFVVLQFIGIILFR